MGGADLGDALTDSETEQRVLMLPASSTTAAVVSSTGGSPLCLKNDGKLVASIWHRLRELTGSSSLHSFELSHEGRHRRIQSLSQAVYDLDGGHSQASLE